MKKESQKKIVVEDEKDGTKGRKRDRLASEGLLLKAAEDIFSKHGFDGATTKMISAKAGVNESLIGRYFEGKHGLLLAIIDHHINSVGRFSNLPYPAQLTFVDELIAYARFKLDNDAKKNFDFFRIVLSQAIVDQKFSKRIAERIPLFHQPELAQRLQTLKSAGKIKAETNIQEVIKVIDTFIFGNVVAQRVLAGTAVPEILSDLEKFIRSYAPLFEQEA